MAHELWVDTSGGDRMQVRLEARQGPVPGALLMLTGGAWTPDLQLELSPDDLDVLAGMVGDAEPASDGVELVGTDSRHFVSQSGEHYMVTTSIVRLTAWGES